MWYFNFFQLFLKTTYIFCPFAFGYYFSSHFSCRTFLRILLYNQIRMTPSFVSPPTSPKTIETWNLTRTQYLIFFFWKSDPDSHWSVTTSLSFSEMWTLQMPCVCRLLTRCYEMTWGLRGCGFVSSALGYLHTDLQSYFYSFSQAERGLLLAMLYHYGREHRGFYWPAGFTSFTYFCL